MQKGFGREFSILDSFLSTTRGDVERSIQWTISQQGSQQKDHAEDQEYHACHSIDHIEKEDQDERNSEYGAEGPVKDAHILFHKTKNEFIEVPRSDSNSIVSLMSVSASEDNNHSTSGVRDLKVQMINIKVQSFHFEEGKGLGEGEGNPCEAILAGFMMQHAEREGLTSSIP